VLYVYVASVADLYHLRLYIENVKKVHSVVTIMISLTIILFILLHF